MSRPIKFRAWDGETMFYDIQKDVFVDYLKLPEYVVMQFTGLMDRDAGVGIYEGDVVRLHGQAFPVGRVGWHQEQARYRVFTRNIDAGVALTAIVASSSEVVGNVFENPELIEKSV